MAETFVLDTSAILALRGNESGAARVEQILRQVASGRTSALLSFMSRMELLYQIEREAGVTAATDSLRLLDAIPVEWVSCDSDILATASRLKAKGGLSVADAWIAATAITRAAILVHKDPEFRSVAGLEYEELR